VSNIPTPSVEPDDATLAEAAAYSRLSRRQVYRLCETGDYESYLLGGARRITWASIRSYREKCRAAGPQLQARQRPVTGKRRPGRPKKLKPATVG
jgi:hypothetical protein